MPAKGQDMAISTYLAKLIGPIFLTIGIGMLVNGAFYRDLITEALASHVLIYLSGVLSLLAGLAIVIAHNRWSGGWPVIITVLGWLMVIGGVIRLVLPATTATLASDLYSKPFVLLIVALVVLVVGAYLCFEGYRARNK